MIELNGRLINPALVSVVEPYPGNPGFCRVYVGGVALKVKGTPTEVNGLIHSPILSAVPTEQPPVKAAKKKGLPAQGSVPI